MDEHIPGNNEIAFACGSVLTEFIIKILIDILANLFLLRSPSIISIGLFFLAATFLTIRLTVVFSLPLFRIFNVVKLGTKEYGNKEIKEKDFILLVPSITASLIVLDLFQISLNFLKDYLVAAVVGTVLALSAFIISYKIIRKYISVLF